MRLDKLLSSSTKLTRSQAQKELKNGYVTVNGKTEKRGDLKVDPYTDEITYHGQTINYSEFTYVLLNKPQGYVSATEDNAQLTVLDLLPSEMKKLGLFPCGRLDKNTTGLIVLTNDGVSAHNALAPKKHVTKKYLFTTADPYNGDDIRAIEYGITLKDGYTTKPCKIEKIDDFSGYIYLTEGKYHEIKRLFGARHNKILTLKRVEFGNFTLDGLSEGEWRYMTKEEISDFTRV